MAKKLTLDPELMNNTKPYFLGLDLGTNSVGWAVTDKDYTVVRKAGKSLWGVRLFQEANTAAARRTFRTARRRHKRAKMRIALLQEYFAEAIAEVDMGFYQRMKDSFFYPDDKSVEQPYTLFADAGFTDQDYHEKYPTIYHLRHELMTSDEPHDVRLVYLACHHIMKNRGNFLLPGERFNTGTQFDEAFDQLRDSLEEEGLPFWDVEKGELKALLPDVQLRKRDKIKALSGMRQDSTEDLKPLSELIIGYKVNLAKLFADEALSELEPKGISLANDYDESRDIYEAILGDRIDVIDAAKRMYDWMMLTQLLGDYNSVSEARIAIYEKHAFDLQRLKEAVREIQREHENADKLFADIFRSSKKGLNNYVAYTGHSSGDGKVIYGRCNESEFFKFLRGVLVKYADTDGVEDILNELEQETFIPKISSSGNGIVPRQLMAAELEAILERAKGYLSFLTDEICQQILQIFNFRLPYYVGPLDNRSSFAWLKRRQLVPVRPWNIEDVVDMENTAEEFVNRLTNKCTYLMTKDVLPKSSLLYSEFMVRNAINMLTVSGQRLDDEYRDEIYDKLFRHRTKAGKITKSRIASLLRSCGLDVNEKQIGGMDIEIPATLKAEQALEKIVDTRLSYKEKEEVIRKITALPDSGGLLLNWLIKTFGEKLTKAECEALSRLRFNDWGTLSAELLSGLKEDTPDGRSLSMIDRMREEPVTLMELLSDKYSYAKKIKEHNDNYLDDKASFSYKQIDEYRASPAVKKMIWQTMRVCQEIFKIMGGVPEKIFLEVTRKKEDRPARTESRKTKLLALYEAIRNEVPFIWQTLSQTEDSTLKSKKLFLYYLQCGRCMYSGKEIDLGDLLSDHSRFDIDHIYPRSLTKDDSFDNLVLVDQKLNRKKSDEFLSEDIRKEQLTFWGWLLRSELLSPKKYERLTRTQPLTPEELEGFISRQMVETNQSIKLVSQILNQFVSTSDLVYVKATHVSDFRYRYGTAEKAPTQFYFPKVREINDLHHAKDAYLNIVVGNAFDTKFTKNFAMYLKSAPRRDYNLDRFFDWKIERNDYVAWEPGDNGTITIVKKMMSRNNALVTRENYRQKGGYFDQMLVKKGKGQFPIKTGDLRLHNFDRYGAFNKVTGSHFCVVEHVKNKKKIRTIMSVPLFLARKEMTDQDLVNYFEKTENLSECKIIVAELKYGSTLLIDGVGHIIKAKTGNKLKCAQMNQAYFTTTEEMLFKQLDRLAVKGTRPTEGDEGATKELYELLISKLGSPPYSDYSSLALKAKELDEHRKEYLEKDVPARIQVIKSILRLLSCNGDVVDLSEIGLKKQVGMLTTTMNLNPQKKYVLSNTSITGFFETVAEI